MAVERSSNFLSQERIDVVDLRSIESAVCYDFDTSDGFIQAGEQPLVVQGLTISVTSTSGNPASNLLLNTAGSVILHPLATESGTIFRVPTNQTAEQLSATNSSVIGSFSAGIDNYVGLDLIRTADPLTADLTKFLDANTGKEVSLTVPKARTLVYRIYITQQPFSVSSNILPIAIVSTDSSNNVSTITDARQMFFRLGVGGDIPNAQASYSWPDSTRSENPITYDPPTSTLDPFTGGDKGINSVKSVLSALQSSIWELRGGDFWYSPVNRDNVQLLYTSSVLSNGDNFSFSGSTLKWKGLKIAFENSGVSYNNIADNDSVGVTLLDQQCLYVDIQRDTVATIVPAVANLVTLGTPVIPGTRFIVAWREGSEVFTRNRAYNVNRVIPVATTSSTGIVQLHQASLTPLSPVVLTDGDLGTAEGVVAFNGNLQVSFTAISGTALTVTGGTSSSTGISGIGGSTAGIGVLGTGGASGGVGVRGVGNSTATGVVGVSTSGTGVSGTGGSSNGTGVSGTGGSTNGVGVKGQGTGSGPGVQGIGVTGPGGFFSSASSSTAIVGLGDIDLSGASVPASTVGIGYGLYSAKTNCRAYGLFSVKGTGAGGSPDLTVENGINVASIALQSVGGVRVLRVTFTTGFTTALSYSACVTTLGINSALGALLPCANQTSGYVDIALYNIAGAAFIDIQTSSFTYYLSLHCFGN